MPTTKDYEAHKHHLDTDLYTVRRIGWDEATEDTTEHLHTTDYTSLAAAQQAAAAEAPQHPDCAWEILRGQWSVDRFDDDEYGRITDAVWEYDYTFHAYSVTNATGTSIAWEVEE